METHVERFGNWYKKMSYGFGILLYGFGSKYRLLEKFRMEIYNFHAARSRLGLEDTCDDEAETDGAFGDENGLSANGLVDYSDYGVAPQTARAARKQVGKVVSVFVLLAVCFIG
jgi:hypothetical protein